MCFGVCSCLFRCIFSFHVLYARLSLYYESFGLSFRFLGVYKWLWFLHLGNVCVVHSFGTSTVSHGVGVHFDWLVFFTSDMLIWTFYLYCFMWVYRLRLTCVWILAEGGSFTVKVTYRPLFLIFTPTIWCYLTVILCSPLGLIVN